MVKNEFLLETSSKQCNILIQDGKKYITRSYKDVTRWMSIEEGAGYNTDVIHFKIASENREFSLSEKTIRQGRAIVPIPLVTNNGD